MSDHGKFKDVPNCTCDAAKGEACAWCPNIAEDPRDVPAPAVSSDLIATTPEEKAAYLEWREATRALAKAAEDNQAAQARFRAALEKLSAAVGK